MIPLNVANPLYDRRTGEVLDSLVKCKECEIKCAEMGNSLAKADFYGGSPEGIMLIAKNPNWISSISRDCSLRYTSTNNEKVAFLRYICIYWLNRALSKLGGKFDQYTLFDLIEINLKGVKKLAGKVDINAIYITDICKACNFALLGSNGIKSCAEKFFFQQEYRTINPIIIIILGKEAYDAFRLRFQEQLTIAYPETKGGSPKIAPKTISDAHGLILKLKSQEHQEPLKYLVPFYHPSGSNRKNITSRYGDTVEQTLNVLSELLTK